MVLDEIIKVIFHHSLHTTCEQGGVATSYLYEQALLQGAGSNARGVELLQYLDHSLYFLLTDIYIVVDSQLVGYIIGRLAKESVVVERTYQVFHHLSLQGRELRLVHLLDELVVKRLSGAIFHIPLTTLIYRQILIIATDAAKGIVEGCLTVFLFRTRLIVIRRVANRIRGIAECIGGIIRRVIGRVVHFIDILIGGQFQGWIVVHLGVYPVDELVDGQFGQHSL